MKIINANAILLKEKNPYKQIELAGRTCYKSEDKITDESAVKFVGVLAKNKHTAMLEHAWLHINCKMNIDLFRELKSLTAGVRNYILCDDYWISGSFRALIEFINLNYETSDAVKSLAEKLIFTYHDVFKYLDSYSDNKTYSDTPMFDVYDNDEFANVCKNNNVLYKHLTHTIKFICDRGVTHEFVRHRPCAFAQESSRYCNYSNDKFGNEITVIHPCFWGTNDEIANDDNATSKFLAWRQSCQNAEAKYFEMIENGAKPEEARDVLPNSLKTELVITATEDEWQHIINLRLIGTTGKPHPQIVEVMQIATPLLIAESNNRLHN